VFDHTKIFLDTLEASPAASPSVWRRFLYLFQLLGFGLRLDVCARCGKSADIHCFDPAHGCVFCRNCVSVPRGMIPLDREFNQSLKWISAPENDQPELDLTSRQQGQLADLIVKYAAMQLDRHFKSAGFLNQVFVIRKSSTGLQN
jgi:recombinational DNA repair protein (RecF pathway)